MPNYQGVWSLSTQYQNRTGWPGQSIKGVWFGGFSGSAEVNVIQTINIDALGNATDFGDLGSTSQGNGSNSSSTRAVCALGYVNNLRSSTTEFIEYATSGNSTSFGSLVAGVRVYLGGGGNSTRGIFAGGSNDDGSGGTYETNIIDYITFASQGNSTDFGDMTATCTDTKASSSPTRTVISLGYSGGASTNVIDYITTASTGNASDFGDLTVARFGAASASSSTRALFMGGGSYTNTIDYVTIASTGNAVDFGDVTEGISQAGACSNNTRALVNASKSSPGSTVYYVTIASTSNTSTFGNLTNSINRTSATSQGHGGLQ